MSKHHLITGDNGNGASTSQALTIRHTAAAPAFAPVTSEITARGSAYSIYRSDPDIQDSRIGTHTFLSSIDLGVIGGEVNTGDRPGRIGGDAITIILLREGGSAHITGTIRNLPAAGDQTDYRIYAIRDGDFWFLYAHNSITRPNPKLGEEFVFLFTLSETGGESDSRYRIYHTEKVEDGRSFDLISDQVTLVEVADTPGVTVFTDPEGVFRAANPGDSTAAASYDVALGTTSAQAVEASDGVGDAFTHKITDSVTANGQTTTYGTLFYNAGTGAWRFDTDDTGASSLESGDTRTITFAVTASTGGSTARHELVVNITGVDEISNHDDAPTFAPATSLITDPASLYIYRSEVDQSGRDDVPMHTFMVSAALEDGAVADEAITIFLLREGVGSAIPITGMISGLPSTGDENDYRIWAVRDGSAWSLHANAITPDPPRPGADEHIFLFTLSETGSASDPVYQLYNTSRVESPD
ncbi:MAG: VCBS domain-containing protein, partial [Parvularculales bacterium]